MQRSPYTDLAAAIILQAIDDYRKAIKHPSPSRYQQRQEIESFFCSRWYSDLSGMDNGIDVLKWLNPAFDQSK